ncbi:Uncharacterised protein [Nocardia farcinica]|uniref:Uncharacterized protein n=1 Tax=Nocardia farcinica TaxID=37329 RepID=A0A449G7E4_NOCFR|nr:hypothetical protein [Nocardia farcinica]VFA94748.1 Uncharacterised protein [Nocardia farcinica]
MPDQTPAETAAMEIKLEMVTPKYALELLELNTRNRTVSERQRSTLTPTGMRTCVKGHEFIRMRRQRRCPICLAEYEERRRSAKARMERERRARRKAAN